MKKIFKNSFFSFLKNKTAVVLLSLIIFLTTVAFTTFNSASRAFEKSYNNVVSEGKLHDFTIKEKYEVNGDAIVKPISDGTDHFDNQKFINQKSPYFFNGGSNGNFLAFSTNAWNKGGQNIDSIFLASIDNVEDYLKNKNSTILDTELIYQKNGQDIEGISNDNLKNDDLSIREAIEDIAVHKSLTANKNFGFENIKLDAKSQNQFRIQNYDVKIDSSWLDNFNQGLQTALDSSYINMDGDYVRYNIALNKPKSGKKYWNYYNEHFSNEKDEFYVSWKENGKTSNYIKNADGTRQLNWNILKAQDVKTFGEYNIQEHIEGLAKKVKQGVDGQQHKATLDYLDSFKDKLNYKDITTLYINNQDSSFKFVDNGNSDSAVDKLKIFSGWGLDKEEKYDVRVNKLKDLIVQNKWWNQPKTDIDDADITDSGSRLFWQHNVGPVPRNQSYIDVSSYSSVISPSYAEENGKEAISKSRWFVLKAKIQKILSDNSGEKNSNAFVEIKKLLSHYSSNVVWAENTPYVVTGIGISPDFSYPIVDASQPIPDAKTQTIIYTNSIGYKRISEAFAGYPNENYIAVKATDQAPDNLFETINTYLTNKMSWPSNMQAARKVNDLNEKYLLAPQRITFLQQLRTTVATISWTTTILLIVFTAFIVGLVIRKQINNRRKQLGILMANGYSRSQISLSMMAIGIIVASFSTILGYITGHFLQFAFVHIFDNYWTLPIWETQFSWITFVTTVVVPIVGISVLAYIISYIELRGNLVNILNEGESKTNSIISDGVMAPFRWMGIKSKLTISIFSSNLSKMVMAFAAFAATITVSTIAINSFGKFDTALSKSEQLSDYEYQVDLASPTEESGIYNRLSMNDLVDPNVVSSSNSKILYEQEKSNGDFVENKKPFFHVPIKDDQQEQDDEVEYMKNRLQIKSLLGPKLGALGFSTSPWDLARKMMPENQKNIADQKYIAFRNWSIDHFRSMKINPYETDEWFPKSGYVIDFQNDNITKNDGWLGTTPHIDPHYIDFVEQSLKAVAKDYETDRTAPIPYIISYGNVIMDEDDETYTHIDSTITYENFQGKKVSESWKIRGIEDNSNRINLSKSSLKALNDFNVKDVTPIVVNKYFAKVHNINVGQTITSLVTNTSNINLLSSTEKSKLNKKFRVVGIEDSYDDGRTFTLQKYANHLLGWDLDKWDPKHHMFNGLYSKHKDELMFNTLSLYSKSGFYEGINKLDVSVKDGINGTMNDKIHDWAQKTNIQVLGDDKDDSMRKYIEKYGATPYVLAYSNVDWAMATDFQFHAVMKLSSSLIWLIEGIAFFISTLFVILISTMIISDNKKFISTLKVLGYRTKEISNVFLRTFIPALFFAIVLASTISSAIVLGIQAVLIGFGNVLIPFDIATWEVVTSAVLLIIGFLITYYFSSKELKNTSLLSAFKE